MRGGGGGGEGGGICGEPMVSVRETGLVGQAACSVSGEEGAPGVAKCVQERKGWKRQVVIRCGRVETHSLLFR